MPRTKPRRAPAEKLEWMRAHSQLPPKEALKLAQQTWPEMRLGYVYALRSLLRAGGMNLPEAPRTMSTSTPGKPRYGHRPLSANTKFILDQSADLSPDEVVELGRKAGLTFQRTAVMSARLRHKSKRKSKPKVDNGVAPQPTAQLAIPGSEAKAVHKPKKPAQEQVVLPLGALNEEEADFMGLALNLGWNRASRLMAQFRVQFFGMLKTHTDTNEE